ncbi:MAG: guanitoxin biosynthesis L-enduracididine beta-hydroxylase GntD [Acidobacteriota bacterium]
MITTVEEKAQEPQAFCAIDTTSARFQLTPEEAVQCSTLLAELAETYGSSEHSDFHRSAEIIAHELPRRLRQALTDFKALEPSRAVIIVSGLDITDEKIGRTPPHWKGSEVESRAVEEEMFLVLLGSLLGKCIGWATQQDGRIVHDILPIEAHKGEQLGSGSEQVLWWHTEDAFHPYRGDYLGMACLRNPDGVSTTFATLEGIDMPKEQWKLLFEEHFTIRPDESHLVKNKGADRVVDGELADAYDEINRMNSAPEKIAVLFGDPNRPYMRLDPYFMDIASIDSPEARAALEVFIEAVGEKLGDLVLEQGDFCFIDNFQAVHGRRPFSARFDGTDRWMKRVNITRDLRKSRSQRESADSPIIL